MEIKDLTLELPWHPKRKWGVRKVEVINKIILHQELGESDIEAVNTYHTGPNHISNQGCPHFCYHYGIRKNGEVVQVNPLTAVTWHTKGQNTVSIGIMLVGNFNGTGYTSGTGEPSAAQLASMKALVAYLQEKFELSNQDIYGHYHFGKLACPGHTIQDWIENTRNDLSKTPALNKIIKSNEEIQKRLNLLDYNCGLADGILGPKTKKAIRDFQEDYDLEVDSVVGPLTWKKLLELTIS